MKRLPPDKRNKLIMVVVATLALISLVYIFLIKSQNDQTSALAAKTKTEQDRAQQIKSLIKQADANASKADAIAVVLDNAESDMASGDVVAWTYNTMQQFKVNRHIDIITMSQPIQLDEDLIPDFPYKQIKFQVTGAGYYYDIGKFLADLENKFPHLRVLNLTIDPNGGTESATEKLSFRIEIAALVKPNS
jgi:Tfp pilus assembly protein PilO